MRALLMPSASLRGFDPCVGDGTALIEITRSTGAHLAGIELDADRAAAATQKASPPYMGAPLSARCWQKAARFCI